MKLKKRFFIVTRKYRLNRNKWLAAFRILEQFKKLAEKSQIARKFIDNLLRTFKIVGSRRGFTLEDKLVALSLFLKDRTVYSFLRSIFIIPTVSRLKALLSKFKLAPGVLSNVIENLAKRVQKIRPERRLAILLFDEMAITPYCCYDKRKDFVYGLADNGQWRSPDVADHVFVVMAVGIFGNWKQVVALAFSKGNTNADTITSVLKAVIAKLNRIDVEIVSSICDQATGNVQAIKALLKETRTNAIHSGVKPKKGIIKFGNNDIIPVFDPPHLIKCIRNNLLKKDCQYVANGVRKVAKWSHINETVKADMCDGIRNQILTKISSYHVKPKNLNKMNISHCVQVLSRTMAKVIHRLTTWTQRDNEYFATEEFCLFINDLFDSLNSQSSNSRQEPVLRRGVTKKSRHRTFWNEALRIVKSMEFIKVGSGTKTRPTVITNLAFTIRSFIAIRTLLVDDRGFKTFSTRRFNQDPLVNLFGQIRHNNYMRTNPTGLQFIIALKGLILNRFETRGLMRFNCERDALEAGIVSVEELIKNETNNSKQEDDGDLSVISNVSLSNFKQFHTKDAAIRMIDKFLSKHVPRAYDCEVCRSNILTSGSRSSACKRETVTLDIVDVYNCQFLYNLVKIFFLCRQCFKEVLHYKKLLSCVKVLLKQKIRLRFQQCAHLTEVEEKCFYIFPKMILLDHIRSLNKCR